MKAVGKNVTIKFEAQAEDIVNKGGIFIPHQATENSKLTNGIILTVGSKCELGFEVGQRVLFDKHAINKYNDNIGVLAEDNIILIEQ